MKPAVLIFSTAYLPMVGGAELAIKEITDRIDEFDFFMITARMSRKYPKHERIGNVEVCRLGLGVWPILDKLLLSFGGVFLARRLIKRNNIQIFWSVMVSYAAIAAVFVKFLNAKIPHILTFQEGNHEWSFKWRNLGMSYLLWHLIFLFNKVDFITAISHALLVKNISTNKIRELGYKGGLEVVPNGVSKKFLAVKRVSGGNEKVIVTASRLVHKNGIDLLIEACAKLKDEFSFRVLIAGDGPERKNLESRINRYELEDRIKLLGYVPYEKLPEFYAGADIFVRPSRSEGLGTAFLEAMAAGLVTIGTRVGGITDFLFDGKTGLVAKTEDVEDLSRAIRAGILLPPDHIKEITKNAQSLIRERFLWDDIATKMQNIFNKLI